VAYARFFVSIITVVTTRWSNGAAPPQTVPVCIVTTRKTALQAIV